MRRETLLKIMGLFRENIDHGLTILQISKRIKIGYRPAYNHINSMHKDNIITIKEVGRAKQCFLNLASEKCRHILEEVDLLRKEKTLKENIKLKNILNQLIPKLTKTLISEIHSIILFGSYAKGKETKESDIDILFIVTDIKNKSLRTEIERECAEFQYSHNARISSIITDIQEFKRMLTSEGLTVGKEVREYGIPLYGCEQFWRLIA